MHTFFISRPLCWCDIIATGNWLSVFCMVTSSNGNIFRVTGHLCGEGPVSSPHKSQWRGALMLFLICVWINVWVNNGEWGWWFETLSRPLWSHRNVDHYSQGGKTSYHQILWYLEAARYGFRILRLPHIVPVTFQYIIHMTEWNFGILPQFLGIFF